MNYRVAWSHDLSNVKQVIVVRMMASSIWKGVKASVASSFRVQYTCNNEVSFLSARSELPAGQVNAQASKSHKPILGFHSSLSLILSPPKKTHARSPGVIPGLTLLHTRTFPFVVLICPGPRGPRTCKSRFRFFSSINASQSACQRYSGVACMHVRRRVRTLRLPERRRLYVQILTYSLQIRRA